MNPLRNFRAAGYAAIVLSTCCFGLGQTPGDPADARAAAKAALRCAIARAIAVAFTPDGFATAPADAQNPPQGQTKPPAKPPEPSLGDLGFPASATQGNAAEQARLDRRSHMLKMHQRMGLITIGPMIATVVTGAFAGGRQTSTNARDLHAAIGGVTGALYFATAYYAIFAPKIAGTPARGPIRLHKALAWIHGPGMVLTPILGVMAFDQKSAGEKIHGIASAHGVVGVVTAAAFGLAVASVTFKF